MLAVLDQLLGKRFSLGNLFTYRYRDQVTGQRRHIVLTPSNQSLIDTFVRGLGIGLLHEVQKEFNSSITPSWWL